MHDMRCAFPGRPLLHGFACGGGRRSHHPPGACHIRRGGGLPQRQRCPRVELVTVHLDPSTKNSSRPVDTRLVRGGIRPSGHQASGGESRTDFQASFCRELLSANRFCTISKRRENWYGLAMNLVRRQFSWPWFTSFFGGINRWPPRFSNPRAFFSFHCKQAMPPMPGMPISRMATVSTSGWPSRTVPARSPRPRR